MEEAIKTREIGEIAVGYPAINSEIIERKVVCG
jgi:hypothetical protein